MINRRRLAVIAVILCVSFISEVYAEEIITARTPDDILNIAKGFGYAKLEKDSQGDPKVSGRIEGTAYGVYFYGCTNGGNCNDVQFAVGWSGVNVSMDRINEWNRTKRYGKAYLDKEGDPILEMAVNLDHGVTVKNFEDTFDWWIKAMNQFKEEVVDG